jgi:hypothetical protein
VNRRVLFFFLVAIGLTFNCRGAQAVRLFHLERRSGEINEWWADVDRLKTLPKWAPWKQAPPLSLKDALSIASRWLKKWDGGSLGSVDSILIGSLHADAGELANTFYYRIDVVPREFDQMSCIVLMDGTVLEPTKTQPRRPSVGTPELGQPEKGKVSKPANGEKSRGSDTN